MNNLYKDHYVASVTSFWNRVRKLCREKKMTINSVSKEVGYNERTLVVMKCKRSMPAEDKVRKMAELFGVSYDYLVKGIFAEEGDGNGKRYFVPIQRQSSVQAEGEESSEPAGFMEMPDNLRPYKDNLLLLYVAGDSMEPTLVRGDLAACDRDGYAGAGIYAIQREGILVMKRVEKLPGKWLIISDNSKYPVLEEPADSGTLRIVGRLRGVYKEM